MARSENFTLRSFFFPEVNFPVSYKGWVEGVLMEEYKQYRLYFLGSKITANGECNHEIKRHLLLGRKVMTNLDSILKSRDITLPTKVHLVQATIFAVVV